MKVTSEEIEKWKERVAYCGDALKDAPEEIKDNLDVVMASIQNNSGVGLKYAGQSVKDNEEVVLAFVSRYGETLQYASERLRDNEEIVLSAIKNDGLALKYASDRLRNDAAFVKKAVEISYFALRYRGESLRDNLDILVAAADNIPKIKFPSTIEFELLSLIRQMSSAVKKDREREKVEITPEDAIEYSDTIATTEQAIKDDKTKENDEPTLN